jgi:hypothetical protein
MKILSSDFAIKICAASIGVYIASLIFGIFLFRYTSGNFDDPQNLLRAAFRIIACSVLAFYVLRNTKWAMVTVITCGLLFGILGFSSLAIIAAAQATAGTPLEPVQTTHIAISSLACIMAAASLLLKNESQA